MAVVAAVCVLGLGGAAARSEVRVSVVPLVHDADIVAAPRSGVQVLGNPPVQTRREQNTARSASRTGPADEQAERIFLDLAMCFNRSVRLVALDFFAGDVAPFHQGHFRWRVLRPFSSLSHSATQWFRVDDAWPVVGPGQSPAEALPAPGAYRAHFEPGPKLGFGDCVGWSTVGDGDGPLAFEESDPTSGAAHGWVAWARSSEGLHDAVELFVKRGTDPLTGKERAAPRIGWTGLERRTYAVRIFYEHAAQPPVPPARRSATPGAPVVDGGNPACWRGDYTFDRCCGAGGRRQDAACWDSFFTFERCCTLTTVQRSPELNFTAPTTPHYELPHLLRDNAPRLGPVQDDEALLLYGLVRAMRPRTIVEFGTSNGFSAVNWMHAIADDPLARVFSYDILPYPSAVSLEDADPRFVFLQKSQTDFEPDDVHGRPVEVVFFDAGHLVEYSLRAFERILPSLSPTAIVAVHDTGLHVADYGTGAPESEEGQPFAEERCALRPGGRARCHRFAGCPHTSNAHGFCVGRAHRPSERQFVRTVLQRWPEFHALHVHSRRVFRHGLTLLQRGRLWDPVDEPSGEF